MQCDLAVADHIVNNTNNTNTNIKCIVVVGVVVEVFNIRNELSRTNRGDGGAASHDVSLLLVQNICFPFA